MQLTRFIKSANFKAWANAVSDTRSNLTTCVDDRKVFSFVCHKYRLDIQYWARVFHTWQKASRCFVEHDRHLHLQDLALQAQAASEKGNFAKNFAIVKMLA
eukprot:2959403-Karenia_brevis.AAC.1